jgi:hypothetical protein
MIILKMRITPYALLILALALALAPVVEAAAIVADHTAVAKFAQVPEGYFDQIRTNYKFYYGHTSHGSQIITGLDMLATENSALYERPLFSEYGDDLGTGGDISWVQPTRDFLDANPGFNVVMWSWCGGVSGNTEEGITAYLDAMAQLETEYPGVKFVYMTGHLDGGGTSGSLYINNNQIRAWCTAHGKTLFDFADIESYDPAGAYYPDGSDACEWCYDWCAGHTCPGCGDCAHSHCFNCYQKGKAWWWLMARVAGWNSGPVTCGDANSDGGLDISDAVFLISYIFGGGPAPNPLNMGDANCDTSIDISDAVYLISYIFGGGPAPCSSC